MLTTTFHRLRWTPVTLSILAAMVLIIIAALVMQWPVGSYILQVN
jgi:hypothetical protein